MLTGVGKVSFHKGAASKISKYPSPPITERQRNVPTVIWTITWPLYKMKQTELKPVLSLDLTYLVASVSVCEDIDSVCQCI